MTTLRLSWVLGLLVLGGCDTAEPPSAACPTPPGAGTVDFFPLEPGASWTYEAVEEVYSRFDSERYRGTWTLTVEDTPCEGSTRAASILAVFEGEREVQTGIYEPYVEAQRLSYSETEAESSLELPSLSDANDATVSFKRHGQGDTLAVDVDRPSGGCSGLDVATFVAGEGLLGRSANCYLGMGFGVSVEMQRR